MALNILRLSSIILTAVAMEVGLAHQYLTAPAWSAVTHGRGSAPPLTP